LVPSVTLLFAFQAQSGTSDYLIFTAGLRLYLLAGVGRVFTRAGLEKIMLFLKKLKKSDFLKISIRFFLI